MSDPYDMIDRFLRNNLGDDDYAEYSEALDSLCSAQPAQAVPVLTDEEIQAAWVEHGLDDCAVEEFARAIEQAVRAKMGVAVPMTDEQAKDIAQQETWGPDAIAMEALLIRVIRQAERHHGIVGKEGA